MIKLSKQKKLLLPPQSSVLSHSDLLIVSILNFLNGSRILFLLKHYFLNDFFYSCFLLSNGLDQFYEGQLVRSFFIVASFELFLSSYLSSLISIELSGTLTPPFTFEYGKIFTDELLIAHQVTHYFISFSLFTCGPCCRYLDLIFGFLEEYSVDF